MIGCLFKYYALDKLLNLSFNFTTNKDMYRQWRQSQNEQGLTEDEIINNIIHEKFEVTIEGDLENKEACCICRVRATIYVLIII